MKVCIVGAGTMGSGIAQTFAAADGFEVLLSDINEEVAAKGKKRIENALNNLVHKGKLEKAKADEALDKITVGPLEMAADCDIVIDAVFERMDIKKDLFGKLQKICGKDTIFASNTSSLSLTEMSRGLDRAVIGMHFFNPAPVMKLVEIITSMQSNPESVSKVKKIAAKIGKTPVEVKESAGFVVNRILIPMINEAIGIYAEGIASAEDIDIAMKLGANHPIGPLALGDLIGLDVCLSIMDVLHQEYGDQKYRAHPLLRKMVRGGLLGRKSGKGFFTYY